MIRQIDRYELLEQVGIGGMAIVYRGRDTMLDREVAVKVLHPHLGQRAESRARFSREARAVARLSHPNIVEIYDYGGETAESGWIVTEFVRGQTLRTFAEEVGFGYPEVGLLVGRALADALAHAHSAGVIHRDLKPENVLVSQETNKQAVKLADFGIARLLATDDRMTMTGALVGSPNHMAPEIIAGDEADARSDVFSLGTIIYWLATGRLPFAAPNPTATLRRIVEGHYEDPRAVNPLVSDELAVIIQRALSPDPALRYTRAADFRNALAEILVQAGLSDPEDELTAFLGNPSSYRQAFPDRIVGVLIEKGEEALARGASARALGLFSRALAYQPHHPRVLEHLQRLERRARAKRLIRTLIAGLALALLVALGWMQWQRSRIVPPVLASAPSPSAEVVTPLTVPSPLPGAGIAENGQEALSANETRERATTKRSQRPTAASVPLAVHVRPYAQRALLDGVEIAHSVQKVTFTIAPGRQHLIQIEHPCCRPFTKQLDSLEASRHSVLRIPLEPKPALLRVEGDPVTRVSMGDRFLGTAGDSHRSPLPVPIPPGDNPYEGQVEIRLHLPGHGVVTMPVRIRAGADVVLATPWKEAP